MQLMNEFEVALPPEQTWSLLTDLEKVAPCLPGASITSREGDEFQGQAKIKVGPITAQYKGIAQFTELDAGNYRAVLLARGKDARGQGDATATVTATLHSTETGTRVSVATDLALTGKVAQFGRGVIADVSGALMGLFAQRLQEMVTASGLTAPAASNYVGSTAVASSAPATVSFAPPTAAAAAPRAAEDEVLDVLALAGGMSWTKVLPAGGTLIAVISALISVFAAGYASAKSRSAGR